MAVATVTGMVTPLLINIALWYPMATVKAGNNAMICNGGIANWTSVGGRPETVAYQKTFNGVKAIKDKPPPRPTAR